MMETYTIEDIDTEHADFNHIRTSQTGFLHSGAASAQHRHCGPPPVQSSSHCDDLENFDTKSKLYFQSFGDSLGALHGTATGCPITSMTRAEETAPSPHNALLNGTLMAAPYELDVSTIQALRKFQRDFIHDEPRYSPSLRIS